ncbi:alpha/beta fold hydrolase [Paenibacillus sp. FJAT-26967]|uniref:stalk domain-containing protein n=1 Tax=Paenibacillus sp. FJAT-26967 TaxID=1729690 RepID=UPI000839676F|nr:alpha/beta fold hydrolase [Paenibacillus sp. FJAT-26967]
MKKILPVWRTAALASFLLASLAPAAPAVLANSPATLQSAAHADSALVPLRLLSETAGASVTWNQDDRTVTISKGSDKIILTIDQKTAVVNGEKVDLDNAVQIVKDKTVVPLGFFKKVLHTSVSWDLHKNELVLPAGDLEAKANAFVSYLNQGESQPAYAMFNEDLRKSLNENKLSYYWSYFASVYGEMKGQSQSGKEKNSVHDNVYLTYETESSYPFQVTVRFDDNSQINDLFIPQYYLPSNYVKPAYDNPAAYTEKEVKIGEGKLALPGTLTLPSTAGPHPVIVLVHGSGSNDRDETMGSSKLFRDLSVGLAAQGIGTLRYEKVTREHPFKSQKPDFTVQDETVNDAVYAINMLAQTEGIDPRQIYVAGHSQGGMLVPRIIESDKENHIAGAVVLAGPTNSIEDVVLEQSKYQLKIAKELGTDTAALEQQVTFWESQVKLIKDPKYSTTNLPAELQLGNTYWWMDFRNYSASAIAKNQKTPMLILQGDNDSQVLSYHLDKWKEALKERTNVQYKMYPKVNHVFTEYDQKSTGAEYSLPANAPEVLIHDIADWVKKSK